jgi:hypothetical protein
MQELWRINLLKNHLILFKPRCFQLEFAKTIQVELAICSAGDMLGRRYVELTICWAGDLLGRRYFGQVIFWAIYANAIIQPYFDYCSPLWDNCGIGLKDRFQKY